MHPRTPPPARNKKGRAPTTVVLALGLSTALAGCSLLGGGGDSATPSAAAPTTSGQQGGASAGPSTSDPSADPSTSASASRSNGSAVLASQQIPLATAYDGTLTVSVLSLTVEDQLTVLQVQLLADSDNLSEGPIISQVIGTPESARALAPELLDPVNLKAYSEAEGGLGLLDGVDVRMSDDVPLDLTFYYAAPQDEVSAFDIVMGTGLPTFRAVPLQS